MSAPSPPLASATKTTIIFVMSKEQTDKWLSFATALASAAELLAMTDFRQATVMRKADDSDLTSTDLRIQRMTCERIRDSFPDHAVLCEEEAPYLAEMPAPGAARFCWVIDPLDGTRNYVRGLPIFCTSIALLEDGQPLVGVIRHFVTGRMYTALRGQGAFAGQRRMKVAGSAFDHRSVVTFQPAEDGNTYDLADSWLRRVHVRNLGSTALHLALVADGNVDGALCVENRLWDVAAGGLMIEESGGIITDLSGAPLFPFDLSRDPRRPAPFIAGSPSAHAPLLAGLKSRA